MQLPQPQIFLSDVTVSKELRDALTQSFHSSKSSDKAAKNIFHKEGDLKAERLPGHSSVILISSSRFEKLAPKLQKIVTATPGLRIIVTLDPLEKKSFKHKSELVFGYLPLPLQKAIFVNLLGRAVEDIRKDYRYEGFQKEIQSQSETIQKILRIGAKLSSEKDIESLLKSILIESMDLSAADSGSIALMGLDSQLQKIDANQLTFFLSENRSLKIDFTKNTIPVSNKSFSGFVALSKKILNIPDAYQIDPKEPYSFNRAFDQATGFHTKSMLIVPMKNVKGNVLGVISLLNKKYDPKKKINYARFADDRAGIFTFDKNDEVQLESLTSLATIALENALLYREIEELFEGFVSASVSAIESRDPTTSGHSFRVADYTTRLAEAVSKINVPPFTDIYFNPEQMKELRYASLLHDFGKVGVRENVLLKAKKLEPDHFKLLLNKFDFYHAQILLEAEKEKVRVLSESGNAREARLLLAEIDQTRDMKLARIKAHKEAIILCNEPTVLTEDKTYLLHELERTTYRRPDGTTEKLVSDEEFRFLSIPRGSLTHDERQEIESHVTHTYRFLSMIPWTAALKDIPRIAYGHHEKLDGTGYPNHLKQKDLHPQSRMMTICDIYDALTAHDRPYKKAIPLANALDILNSEVREKKIDPAFFDVFVKKKIYQQPDESGQKAAVKKIVTPPTPNIIKT